MDIFFLIIVLIILFILIGIFVKRRSVKIQYIKMKLSKSERKSIIESVFQKNFLFYEHLNNTFKEKLITDSYILSELIDIDGIGIKITDEIKKQDEETIFQGLLEYNLARIEDKNPKDLGVYFKDEKCEMLAGLIGNTHGNWLTVKFLWISENLRGQGIGSKIF